jgi:predicted O-methyltransferase YrrM
MALGAQRIVETGCYRGIHFDGQSTLIWALIARFTGGHVVAIDISPDSIAKATELLKELLPFVTLVNKCSLVGLVEITEPIDVLYLDSFDHEESNPLPCQEHQLAEAKIAVPKMAERSIIMLDDCNMTSGGKALLSDPFIRESGFTQVAKEYQNIYHRGCDNLF